MSSVTGLNAIGTPAGIGRGTRIPDMPVLLAVLAARQALSPTMQRMRAGDPQMYVDDEPARLSAILAPTGTSPAAARFAVGSFNRGMAARLAMGANGEGGVYFGA